MSRVEPAPEEHATPAAEWFTHHVRIANDPFADALGLPPSRGVVVMFGDSGRPVFIAATGDCRALMRRKLAPAELGVRAGADLRSIIRDVRAVECGSAFEADLAYLVLAREFMPHAAKLVADRWRSWWAQIDADSPFPEWSKTDLALGAVAPRSASTAGGAARDAQGTLIGPFGDKDAAGRFIERMIDAFDLCREHRLLVLAPHAKPCPYKEMGRCAAPCDGSESMESYRRRVRAAVAAAAAEDGIAGCMAREDAAMRAAAAEQDFEAAARHRANSERLAKLSGAATARLCQLENFQYLLIWRSPKQDWVRVACCDRGFVRWLADLRMMPAAAKPTQDVVDLCRGVIHWADTQHYVPMGRAEVETLGLLARERVAPDTRRSAWFVPLHREADPEVRARSVMRAAAAAWMPRKPAAVEEAEGPLNELEAMSDPAGGHEARA